jgi:hypothetical protein
MEWGCELNEVGWNVVLVEFLCEYTNEASLSTEGGVFV